jgi:DegV family protein with EDD domain
VQAVRADREITEASIQWMAEEQKKTALVITTDSIADLPAEIIRRFRIGIIPHVVRTEEGDFQDGKEVDADGVIDYMEREKKNARALAPDTAVYEAFFAKQLSRANQVLHISISSKIAGSGYYNAIEAARAFHNVTVFDSRHLSSGEGLLVMRACLLAESGMAADEIVRTLEAERRRIRTSFIMDNMDYLERAGLVSRGRARLFKTLMMHPVIRLRQGEIRISHFLFGALHASRKRYFAFALRSPAVDRSVLFVTSVGLSEKELDSIRTEIDKYGAFEQVYYQKASPAIAANCGPGTVGLLFQVK